MIPGEVATEVHRLQGLSAGELRMNASRDGQAIMFGVYGARGGFQAGADLPIGSIPALVQMIDAIDREARELLVGELYVVNDRMSRVPELGTH